MNFQELHDSLVSKGYTGETADAKIAHDVLLHAINVAGFRENLTVKGGVVMSGITDLIRRATMDMDVDFLHYSISHKSVRHFVAVLNRISPYRIQIDGEITELKHQDYKGKRVYLRITDSSKTSVRTKLDIGVHTRDDVRQEDFNFKVVTDQDAVSLLVNSKEQIFIEKLKSLLRIGPASTRYKDVYDLYYLRTRVKKSVVKKFLQDYVFDDEKLREKNLSDVVTRLTRTFSDRIFNLGLRNPTQAWLDESVEVVTNSLIDFITKL